VNKKRIHPGNHVFSTRSPHAAIRRRFEHPGKIDLRKVDPSRPPSVLDPALVPGSTAVSALVGEGCWRGLSAGRGAVGRALRHDRRSRARGPLAFGRWKYWSPHARLRGGQPPEFRPRPSRKVRGEKVSPRRRGPPTARVWWRRSRARASSSKAVDRGERGRKPGPRRGGPVHHVHRCSREGGAKLHFYRQEDDAGGHHSYAGGEIGGRAAVGPP